MSVLNSLLRGGQPFLMCVFVCVCFPRGLGALAGAVLICRRRGVQAQAAPWSPGYTGSAVA